MPMPLPMPMCTIPHRIIKHFILIIIIIHFVLIIITPTAP
jgi:hypothetical protein